MIGQDKIRSKERDIEMLGNAGYNIKVPIAIAQLRHEPTTTIISVYKPIPKFQQFFLRWCFGLKYKKL